MTSTAIIESRAVLARHAKSFRFAALFLPQHQADAAAVLYRFCRVVDDAIDEAPRLEVAQAEAIALAAELKGEQPGRSAVADFLSLQRSHGIDMGFALDLIDGVASDAQVPLIVANHEQLLRYCYAVAGTVGGMMCPVLGVKDPAAMRFAIDLGIGMQLTNICRDVLEDAHRHRCYLPADALASPSSLPSPPPQEDVKRVVSSLLALAERYYASGEAGLRYIPWRARTAIGVAAAVYRAIGRKLMRQGGDPLQGRVSTTTAEKVAVAMVAIIAGVARVWSAPPVHDGQLHAALSSLERRFNGGDGPRGDDRVVGL